MCLITYQRKAKITKEDIVVLKEVLRTDDPNVYISRFNRFLWKKNVMETQVLEVKRVIRKKANFYDNIANDSYSRDYKFLVTSVSKGFHAAKNKDRITFQLRSVIKEFLIPKGSLTFEDKTGLIVSDHMMML